MATHDGFTPDRSPLFLSEHPESAEQLDIGKALNRATMSSRVLKASMVAVTTTAIGIAILAVADPVEILGNVTALWVEKSTPQPDSAAPAPTTQSIASTQEVPPARDMPAHEEIAVAAVEPANPGQANPNQANPGLAEPGQANPAQAEPSQAEIGQPVTEALFKQFQAWAAEEESRAKAEPVQPAQAAPVQAAPVQVARDAPAQVQPTKRHRRARSIQNARAEIRPHRTHRARVREEQNAPMPIAPVPDPRAQEQAVQNFQPPGFLQSLGFRN
jgi:hypothetical protein